MWTPKNTFQPENVPAASLTRQEMYFLSKKKAPAVSLTNKKYISAKKDACGKPHTQKYLAFNSKKTPAGSLTCEQIILHDKKRLRPASLARKHIFHKTSSELRNHLHICGLICQQLTNWHNKSVDKLTNCPLNFIQIATKID